MSSGIHEIIVSGVSGFLGNHIVERAPYLCPEAQVIPISSPRHGGINLAGPDAAAQLLAKVRLKDPSNALLIHAAALVEWNTPDAFLANSLMALNVATWAQAVGIGFSVLVSGVNVYSEDDEVVGLATAARPASLYGVGKLAAEQIWRLLLPDHARVVVRLAGIWGWQPKPTLFWNCVLLRAARGTPPEPAAVIKRRCSRRNYISAIEAAQILIGVGMRRITGNFLAAGKEVIDNESFVCAVQSLPGSRLRVDWQDDGITDQRLYCPSPEIAQWLRPFADLLLEIWQRKPAWVQR